MLDQRHRELTPTQRGMVFHQLLDPHSGNHIQQLVVAVGPSLSAGNLAAAWHAVIAGNDLLRSRVAEYAPGEYRLTTTPGFVPEIVQIDLAGPNPELGFDEWLADDRRRGVDVFADVPLRLSLLRSPGGTRFVWTFHHVLLDRESAAVILMDVWTVYQALNAGQSVHAPVRPDHAAPDQRPVERGPAPSIAYWRKLLATADEVTAFPAIDPSTGSKRNLEMRLDAAVADSIAAWVQANRVTFSGLVQAAWATLLSRYTDRATVVFGVMDSGRAGQAGGTDLELGMLASTVPMLAMTEGVCGVELVRAMCEQAEASRPHAHVPLSQMKSSADGEAEKPLFRTLLSVRDENLDALVHRLLPSAQDSRFMLHEQTSYPVAVTACAKPHPVLRLEYEESVLTPLQAGRLLDHLRNILGGIVAHPEREARRLPLLTGEELDLIDSWNATSQPIEPNTIQAEFARAVSLYPERAALTGAGRTLNFAQLDAASDAVAAALEERGVAPGTTVAISLDRSLELVVAMLGVLKAGAAYLPLDPAYPVQRIDFCLRDSYARWVITQQRHAAGLRGCGAEVLDIQEIAGAQLPLSGTPRSRAEMVGSPDDPAYMIYTSGSTGKPKGVLVTHRNVTSFLAGMDEVIRLDGEGDKRWLAVTSASFDISVLELLWTLTRGVETVIHGARPLPPERSGSGPSFSLFHFASGADASDAEPYRLILQAARFADENGLEAVWSPERHFHDFGAPYPNPSVISAALAMVTSRVQLRAGSVVLPLHHPLSVVEDWSLVDNLSNGRVGVSFASGWQPNDFVIAPDNYERRKELMFEQIQSVRALWRGERIEATNPKGDKVLLGTFPHPVQPELPVWVTAAGSPDTFRQAGAIGANILTHMLGQSLADLENNIRAYREARLAAGHDPADGRVTVMVHTFVGEDTAQVRELVREPMQRYLRSAGSLVGSYADAWAAFKRGAGHAVGASAIGELGEQEQQDLYDFAFERYFQSSGLLGSVEKCAGLVASLQRLGVDEIACLIDFGVAPQMVIEHLPYVCRLRDFMASAAQRSGDPGRDDLVQDDLAGDIARHAITHLQCTPSMASTIPMLARDRADLASLQEVLIGGEALAPDLLAALDECLPPQTGIVNMYGPTETTVWSTTQRLQRGSRLVGIGRPIANTQCYVLDSLRQLVPPGYPGELHIGGAGVAAGYHRRPELQADRFIEIDDGGRTRRVYATGDLVRQRPDGQLEYLGRNDFQVKVRGHRIEPGEIEMALREQPGIVDAVVVASAATPGPQMLVGYLVGSRPETAGAVETLKSSLRGRLPVFMVPDVFVWIDSLPLTPNGKIDRQALPAPVTPGRITNRADGSVPRSEAEQVIADVWKRVLGLSEIGMHDNFFDLGGHSILAIKVQAELSQAFGQRLPIVELFRSPTIEGLAARFGQSDSPQPPASVTTGAGKAGRRKAAMNLRVAVTGKDHELR